MNVNANHIIGLVLGITALGLIFSQSSAFNSILGSVGGLTTNSIAILQGRSAPSGTGAGTIGALSQGGTSIGISV